MPIPDSWQIPKKGPRPLATLRELVTPVAEMCLGGWHHSQDGTPLIPWKNSAEIGSICDTHTFIKRSRDFCFP